MKTEHFYVDVGRPGLPEVIEELASILISDDWTRHSTDDDRLSYYILGMKAWTANQEGTLKAQKMSLPAPQPVSPLRESQVHAQVAATKPGAYYVNRAKARLQESGVDDKAISAFVDGMRGADVNWDLLKGQFAAPERVAALADLLQALVLEKGLEPTDDASQSEKMQELHVAVQKTYLREFGQLYGGVVRRATSLESLTFSDPQLNEASRCFLYGFFGATVILSASALESSLRKAIGEDGLERVDTAVRNNPKRGFFNRLVDEADFLHVLGTRTQLGQDPLLVAYSRRIFEERTKVVHKGLGPTKELAEEILTKARQVIEHIHENHSVET